MMGGWDTTLSYGSPGFHVNESLHGEDAFPEILVEQQTQNV
jgi:hypothetical protein